MDGRNGRSSRRRWWWKGRRLCLRKIVATKSVVARSLPVQRLSRGIVQSYTKALPAATKASYDSIRHSEDDAFLQNYRKAAKAHRSARRWVWKSVKPDQTLVDIAKGVEDSVRALLGHTGRNPETASRPAWVSWPVSATTIKLHTTNKNQVNRISRCSKRTSWKLTWVSTSMAGLLTARAPWLLITPPTNL